MTRRVLGHSLLAVGILCGAAGSDAAPVSARATPGATASGADMNWPQWRGPNGNRFSRAVGLPTTWSLSENIVWKAALPSWGAGTPIVWGERVFVTSASAPEAEPAAPSEPAPGR